MNNNSEQSTSKPLLDILSLELSPESSVELLSQESFVEPLSPESSVEQLSPESSVEPLLELELSPKSSVEQLSLEPSVEPLIELELSLELSVEPLIELELSPELSVEPLIESPIEKSLSPESLLESSVEQTVEKSSILQGPPSIINPNLISNVPSIENLVISSILQKILQDNTILLKLQLNQKNIDIINMILNNHPAILDSISLDISKIISNGQLEINDIPLIVLLMKDIINLYTNSNDLKLTKEQIINFIKDIIILIIESDEIRITDDDKKLFINLISISVQLLSSEINLKEKFICKWC